jgi:hypothetical protein
MDPDINKYDLNHAVTTHSRMSMNDWQRAYRSAWETYYTDEHIETVLKRAAATGVSPGKALFLIVWFKGCISIEGIHPLEGGFLRLRFRRDRRPELPRQSPLVFYPKFMVELLARQIRWAHLYLRLYRRYGKLKKDPRRLEYMDLAITPVTDDEIETREMFQTAAARNYVVKIQRAEKLRTGAAA